MIRLEHFKAKDWRELREQKAMAYVSNYITDQHLVALEKAPYAYTGFSGTRPVFCAGVTEYWKGRGEAWAVLDENCREDFISIHKTVKRFLDICPVRRIEAAVDVDFKPGHRWVKALGFQLETSLAKGFCINGGDASIYVRVRDEWQPQP